MEWLDSLNESDDKWQEYIYNQIMKSVDSVLQDIDEMIDICNEEEGPASYLDNVLEERSSIGGIKKAADIFELSKKLNLVSLRRQKAETKT